MKYPGITLGRVEAVWNKLGGEEGVDRFLRDELTVPEPARSWREQDGVIYFSVTSDGTIGVAWVTRLKSKGFWVSDNAESMLRSRGFKPTTGITTEVAVLKGVLFSDWDRITKKIRAEANERKLLEPNAEIACLIREKFTDKEIEAMGLRGIIAMHEPIICFGHGLRLLGACHSERIRWLNSSSGDVVDKEWFDNNGFAFAVSQVSC